MVEKFDAYPIAVLGGSVQQFLQEYSGRINRVETLDEIRELVDYYHGVSGLDYPIVIGDLSFLPNTKMAEALLLKFLEESRLKIIIYATYDTLSGVILSRMRQIFKSGTHEVKSMFMPPRRAYEALQEVSEDTHYSNRLKIITEVAPKYYYLEKTIRSEKIRDKLFKIGS